jgi:hypothetical protein
MALWIPGPLTSRPTVCNKHFPQERCTNYEINCYLTGNFDRIHSETEHVEAGTGTKHQPSQMYILIYCRWALSHLPIRMFPMRFLQNIAVLQQYQPSVKIRTAQVMRQIIHGHALHISAHTSRLTAEFHSVLLNYILYNVQIVILLLKARVFNPLSTHL